MTDSTPRLLRLPEVERVTGMRRSAIYTRIQQGKFPVPLRISDRCSAWREAEIIEWIDALPRGTSKTATSASSVSP